MYSNVVAAAAELASESCCRVKWSKQRKMYECTRCGYASERKSNVGRHFRRIHCELKKHKTCVVCEESFSTKGEFYEHCEKEHPHLRHSCFITTEKYKIGKKQNRTRCNQTRSSQRARAVHKKAFIDETSEEETSDSTFYDNDNDDVNRSEEDQVQTQEMEEQEMEEQEMSEEVEDHQEDEDKSENEQENVEVMNYNQKVKNDHVSSSSNKVDKRKVIVEELSKVYVPIPYPTPDNDDSSSWSHKANESLTSSPVRSLRTDAISPILWTHASYRLPATPTSSTEFDDSTSSPARTIRTDDFVFSPAKSLKTDSTFSPARSLKNDDFISSASTSPEKVYQLNRFMSSAIMSPNVFPSSPTCSPKVGSTSSSACCNISLSDSNAATKINLALSRLPLKKRFGNVTERKPFADITNAQNNEFNVKSRFNNNEIQVANRNFSTLNDNQQAFFTNIDFDDLEAVLILKSLKESNH